MATSAKKKIATPEQFDGAVLMRVTEQNLKVVRYVDISLDRPLTLLGGENGQGKTTFLDGVDWVFGDKKTIQMDPIQHGKQQGSVTVYYGDGEKVTLKITKTLKRVGDQDFVAEVDLEIPGYLAPSRVQEFLENLKGSKRSLDPMWFDGLEGVKQLLALRDLVDFDFDSNKAEYDNLYKQRTEVNKDRDREQAAANSIDVTDKAPGEKVDEAALTDELEAAGTKNTDIERRRSNREKAAAEVARLRSHADEIEAGVESVVQARQQAHDNADADLESQIQSLERQLAALRAKRAANAEQLATDIDVIRANASASAAASLANADELQAKLDAAEQLPPVTDASAITAKLNEARRVNRLIEDWETQRARKAAHQREADLHAKESDELTARLAELLREKQDAILKANLPIDGLGFADDHVTLHGAPWQQASEAQRIDASMAIAMAHNPKLRTILIRHGSGIGRKIRERIQQRAAERGYRVIMEVYDETGANSHIFIEDGLVKKIDGQEIVAQEPERAALAMEQEPDVTKVSDPAATPANESTDARAPRAHRRWQGPGAPTGGAA